MTSLAHADGRLDGPRGRIRAVVGRVLQVEDLVLAATLLAGALFGTASDSSLGDALLRGDRDPLLGAFALLAVLGAMAAMATRVPGESRVDGSPSRYWMIGPFVGAVGFTCGNALELLGIEGGDVVTGPALLVTVLSMVLADRLPVVSRGLRRVLVGPFVLLSGAVFQGLTHDLTSGATGLVDLDALLAHPQALQLVVTIVAISLAVSWIFYAMLVFAPRELADPGAPPRWWAARFGVFWLALMVGLALGARSGSLSVLAPGRTAGGWFLAVGAALDDRPTLSGGVADLDEAPPDSLRFQELVIGIPGEGIGSRIAAGALDTLTGDHEGAFLGRNFLHQGSTGIAETAQAGDRFGSALP